MAASGGTKPASPVLMTAYVILQDHPLPAGGRVWISRSSRRMQPAYPSQARDGDTIVAIAAGEAMTERHALRCCCRRRPATPPGYSRRATPAARAR
jgi:hypothetical protein